MFEINTDSFFRIGKTHRVCEDYALHGTSPVPYVIVSDGCSSSNHVDVGARILAHSAKVILKHAFDSNRVDLLKYSDTSFYKWLGDEVKWSGRDAVSRIGIPLACLDATLIVAFYFEQTNEIIVCMYGDGCVVFKSKETGLGYVTVDFKGNAPYYLSYWLDDNRNESYKNFVGKDALTLTDYVGGVENKTEYDFDHYSMFRFLASEYDFIGIASDGIGTFSLPIIDVVKEFTAFKNTTGEFVRRRMGKAIQTYNRNGIDHMDDASFGVLNITEVAL